MKSFKEFFEKLSYVVVTFGDSLAYGLFVIFAFILLMGTLR